MQLIKSQVELGDRCIDLQCLGDSLESDTPYTGREHEFKDRQIRACAPVGPIRFALRSMAVMLLFFLSMCAKA